MRSIGVVYAITDTVNGKFYVGQTWQPVTRRLRGHFARAKHGSPYPLHAAMRELSRAAFSIAEIGRHDTQESLDYGEREAIKYLCADIPECGYNCTSGGLRSFEFTPEIRARQSKMKSEWLADPAVRKMLSGKAKARIAADPEWVKHLGSGFKGRKHSDETRARMAAAHLGKRKKIKFGD